MPEFVKFTLRTDPSTEVLKFRVRGLITGISDMRGLFTGFGELFKAAMQKQFASEGGASGGWAALSPAYAAWKAEHGFPGMIGVLHGFLRSGMTGGAGYTQHVHKTSADYGLGGGPALAYGGYFDGGNTRGMPARKVIAFGAGERATWRRLVEEWAYETAVKSGWGL
jgi:hypothetical protein